MGGKEEELNKEGQRIAKKLGNGVVHIGSNEAGHWFNDRNGATFIGENLNDAKRTLRQLHKRFGLPSPNFK